MCCTIICIHDIVCIINCTLSDDAYNSSTDLQQVYRSNGRDIGTTLDTITVRITTIHAGFTTRAVFFVGIVMHMTISTTNTCIHVKSATLCSNLLMPPCSHVAASVHV